MNRPKISELKQSAEAAQAAYTAEQSRLVAYGLRSQERYAALQPLKAAADAAHAAYVKVAHAEIKGELNKIIREDAPARAAAARARSPWKQAKHAARRAVV